MPSQLDVCLARALIVTAYTYVDSYETIAHIVRALICASALISDCSFGTFRHVGFYSLQKGSSRFKYRRVCVSRDCSEIDRRVERFNYTLNANNDALSFVWRGINVPLSHKSEYNWDRVESEILECGERTLYE